MDQAKMNEAVMNAMNADLDYVRQNYQQLLKNYGKDMHIAVRDGQIFGSHKDWDSLITFLSGTYPRQGFSVISLSDPRLTGEEDISDLNLIVDECDSE